MANTKKAAAQKKAVPAKKADSKKVASVSKPIKLGGVRRDRKSVV